ncbi:RDD family protein [Kribbella shirazensis]|uniref:RDD family protein n=1 Tax=Kribbella shirazensis TaxID=1105143 RepID=A0A7X5VJR6_9ACTN|nr:RDD family protein [Kribbella shirazensis]NIK62502.1 hypothetical protein [Kribbella shirazensis]
MIYEQDRLNSLDQVREQLKPMLGESVTKRVKAYKDGTLYVESTMSAALGAWLVDSVLVNGTAIALGVLYYAGSTDPNKAAGSFVIALSLFVVLPLLYGWFYGNGRGVGALLTDTRLVRARDGSRVGLAKAGWAMLIRTLLIPLALLGALGGGGSVDAGGVRVSIDVPATARLRMTAFQRVP